ncbi:hypothetical protein C8Q74DRAFT_1220945 [Fomes fomentarius]|nr:hypothetical protein C8Q74DRAFT_1220945 [Fomes fomentarius]
MGNVNRGLSWTIWQLSYLKFSFSLDGNNGVHHSTYPITTSSHGAHRTAWLTLIPPSRPVEYKPTWWHPTFASRTAQAPAAPNLNRDVVRSNIIPSYVLRVRRSHHSAEQILDTWHNEQLHSAEFIQASAHGGKQHAENSGHSDVDHVEGTMQQALHIRMLLLARERATSESTGRICVQREAHECEELESTRLGVRAAWRAQAYLKMHDMHNAVACE